MDTVVGAGLDQTIMDFAWSGQEECLAGDEPQSMQLTRLGVMSGTILFSLIGIVFYRRRQTTSTGSHTITAAEKDFLLDCIPFQKWCCLERWIKTKTEPQLMSTNVFSGEANILHYVILFSAPLTIVERLVEIAPELVHSRTQEGDLPLHRAVRLGLYRNSRMFQSLLAPDPETAFVMNHASESPISILWERSCKRYLMEVVQVEVSCSASAETRIHLLKKTVADEWLLPFLHSVHKASQLQLRQEEKDDVRFLPMHMVADRIVPPAMFRFLLEARPKSLVTPDSQGRLPLLIAASNPTANKSSLHEESKLDVLTDLLPEALCEHAGFYNDTRLPLHAALASGVRWGEGVEKMIESYPQSMSAGDPVTRLSPFALAAASETSGSIGLMRDGKLMWALRCDSDETRWLDTVYSLLRMTPELVSTQVPLGLTSN